ncbi:MAG: methyl-accepting chemotaxis protein [Syntrophales bacterium]
MAQSGRAVEKECKDARDNQLMKLQAQVKQANPLILDATLLAIILGLFFTFLITRLITKPIHNVIEGLNTSSDHVAGASADVATASHTLAEGATEHAAIIQETSSSLEELSSMTRKNVDNATEAKAMMGQAKVIVERASSELNQMISAVEEISKGSEEIGKIIKTIDSIAFQTNLLALNAAVEAARAGEAGAGSSVVAEEVRSLAIRSAKAAQSTSALIEDSIKSMYRGSELTKSTQDAFTANQEIAIKIAMLVDEIAAACQEQAQGTDQSNKAVAEMDTVVQRNAASANESASASEEMNAMAVELKHYVCDLIILIDGAGRDRMGNVMGRSGPELEFKND